MEEEINSQSEPKSRKVESEEKDSDIGEQVHFNNDKEVAQVSKPTLALLPN